jgi:DNA-binding transcriptional MocR family regulator
MLTEISSRILDESDTPTAKAIAAAIGRMITSGALPVDAKLPTVRQLSRSLDRVGSLLVEAAGNAQLRTGMR